MMKKGIGIYIYMYDGARRANTRYNFLSVFFHVSLEDTEKNSVKIWREARDKKIKRNC